MTPIFMFFLYSVKGPFDGQDMIEIEYDIELDIDRI
jgi:hypothetical protein